MSLSYRYKQTLLILVVCILGVAAAGYAAYGDSFLGGNKSVAENNDITATPSAEPIPSSTDWQKQFAAQDKTTAKLPRNTTKVTPEPETLTGQFGKKFFEQYAYLKQSNLTENPEAVKALVEQATENLVNAAPQARVYDVREIILSPASGVEAEKAYANTVGTIFSAYVHTRDAATVALQALEQDDKSKMTEVEATARAYGVILKQLLAVPVPKSLAMQHVNLINGISSMSFVSQAMTKVFTDPIQTVPALAIYEQSLGKFQDALLDLKFAFTQNYTQFASSEPATIIFNMTN